MDSLKVNFNHLDNIISNVIRREIDCLTDEVYKADKIYCITDSKLTRNIGGLLNSINCREVLELKELKESLPTNAVLLGIFFDKVDEKTVSQVKAFNKTGRTVLITDEYDNGELLQSRETIGVHIPAEVESPVQKKVLISQALHLILDDINLKIQSKEASKPVM